MKITMIAVGSEAQYRNHFDTAYQYLSRELPSVNAEIESYRILRADPSDLFAALKAAMQQSETVVLLSAPDPTCAGNILKVICSGLELPSATDPALEAQVRQKASRLGLEYSYEQMASFATFPKGARMLRNPGGLVQGYAILSQKQSLLVLPAVPSELASLYPAEIRPLLAGRTGLAASYGMVRVLEADQFSVERVLAELNGDSRLHLSSQQNCGDYEIYIEAIDATQESAAKLKDSAIARLRERFGICLYCIGNQSLPSITVDHLAKSGLTLASAELGTGALFSRQFAEEWGASGVYHGGFGEEEVQQELRLPHKLLTDSDGCSASLAATLAVQCRKAEKSSLGVGICCRPADTAAGQSPRIIVAIADKRKIWTKRLELPLNRTPDQIAQLAVWQALNMLRLYAAQYPTPLPGGTDVSAVDKRVSGLPALFPHKSSVSKSAPPSTASGAETGNNDEKEHGTMKFSSSRSASRDGADAAQKTNLIQRIKMHQLSKNDKLRLLILLVCVLVFIACIVYIASVKMESVTNAQQSQELNNLYGSDVGNVDDYPIYYIKGFEALYQINKDIAGWITIDNTKVNYAVVQAEDNNKYDRTDFYLKSNQHGIPYVDFRVDLTKPSFNTIIYSHNMGDGQMFGELINYKKLTYYQAHPLVTFNSVYRENTYKIFAVVVCKANDPDFSYHNFIDSGDTKEIDSYLQSVLERSIIKTTVDVNSDDHILTLSTCDYSFKDPDTGKRIARFVIFAREVREGESTDVNTNGAILNPNPVMPEEWYEYIQQQQDKKEAEALEKEQKAYIDLWLTDAEKTGTTEEQYALAQQRAADSEKYLTASELSSGMTPDELLESINYRKKLFKLLIAEDEASLSASSKVTLCEDRAKALADYFTDEELWEIEKWSVLSDRYKVITSESNIKLYLTEKEIKDTTQKAADQLTLISSRKTEAKKYLTTDQINACADWDALSAKITQSKSTRADLETKALKAGYTQAEIDKMTLAELKAAVDKMENQSKIDETIAKIKKLNPNMTSLNNKPLEDASLDDLTSILNQLQTERTSLETAARKYGMTEAKIAELASNAALSEGITSQKATYDALVAKILKDYPGKKTQTELEAMTYAQLVELQTTLSKPAATSTDTPSTSTNTPSTSTDTPAATNTNTAATGTSTP